MWGCLVRDQDVAEFAGIGFNGFRTEIEWNTGCLEEHRQRLGPSQSQSVQVCFDAFRGILPEIVPDAKRSEHRDAVFNVVERVEVQV